MAEERDIPVSRKKPKLRDRWETFSERFRGSLILYRTFSLLTALLIFFVFLGYGFYHRSAIMEERTRTLTDFSQVVTFSKTGAALSMEQPYRNGDITVLPIHISAPGDTMSYDAKDYKVIVLPSGKDTLSQSLKGTFVMFGSTGDAAIILRGPMKQGPMQLVLRNDVNYVTRTEGTGTLVIDGMSVPVDYNAVSVIINPKGENVEHDKRIQRDMSVSELYKIAFGDDQLKSIEKEKKTAEKVLKVERERNAGLKSKLATLNRALGYKLDDTEIKTDVEGTPNLNTNYQSFRDDADDDAIADLSNADIEGLRSMAVSEYLSSTDKIAQIETDLDGFDANTASINKLIDTMPNLSTSTDRFAVQGNSK